MNRALQHLFIFIILALGLTPAFGSEPAPATPRQLLEHFTRAYNDGDFVEAIRWGLEFEKVQPGDARHQYNLACVYALVGNERTATACLIRAI
ncbi:MAG: hypothetical protein ABFS37_17000, partial [Acidobacteriota bacterium]